MLFLQPAAPRLGTGAALEDSGFILKTASPVGLIHRTKPRREPERGTSEREAPQLQGDISPNGKKNSRSGSGGLCPVRGSALRYGGLQAWRWHLLPLPEPRRRNACGGGGGGEGWARRPFPGVRDGSGWGFSGGVPQPSTAVPSISPGLDEAQQDWGSCPPPPPSLPQPGPPGEGRLLLSL